jgi:hypothetical protein
VIALQYTLSKSLMFILSPTMNRSELQDQLIQNMLDNMDLKTLMSLCYDFLDANYDLYSDDELNTEINEYYPELLESV